MVLKKKNILFEIEEEYEALFSKVQECISRRCLGHNLTYDEDLS